MKKPLTILLIFWNINIGNAQVIPTQFDTFINKASIEWAAYFLDTVRFTEPNLSDILIERMEKQEIKTSRPIIGGTKWANKIIYTDRKQNKERGASLWQPLYDSMEVASVTEYNDSITVDSHSFNLLYITQILFVEKGKLKCYIPWVTPAYSMFSSNRIFFATGEYFSTCFNFKYNFTPNIINDLLYLGQIKRKAIIDSIPKNERLKELYGKNLLESLWPYVLDSTFSIYDVDTGKKINIKKIDDFIMDTTTRNIYDSVGNEIGVRYFNENPIPFYIKQVEIVQDWYYDYKSNLVFCKIPYILLDAKRRKNGIVEKEFSPALKIVLN
ncbi:MAG: hypothetical protein V4685_09455 [Bacteroidota bacterium]